MSSETLCPGTRLTHMKGMPYQFLFFTRHSETTEEFAVYECLYENPRGTLWIRPRAMFEESTLRPDGTQGRRFAPLKAEDGSPLTGLGIASTQAAELSARLLQRAQKQTSLAALESGFASLALARETKDAKAVTQALACLEKIAQKAGLEGVVPHE
jgi:hypothetical protein